MIIQLNTKNLHDFNTEVTCFSVIGRIIPIYEGENWAYTEEIFPQSYEKTYPYEEIDLSSYIDSQEKAVFLFYDQGICVGQIQLHANWNNFAFIDNLVVCQKFRGKGIGRALINQAKEWAKQKRLQGLMLETQDNNLLACRFYAKLGLRIGGVDDMLYANTKFSKEKAVFWYLKF